MLLIIAAFLLSFVQNYLATKEIYWIAKGRCLPASLWAGIRAATSFTVMVLVVVNMTRWHLLIPFVLGDMLATNIAVRNSAKVDTVKYSHQLYPTYGDIVRTKDNSELSALARSVWTDGQTAAIERVEQRVRDKVTKMQQDADIESYNSIKKER